jgi:hypothetical protein
MLGLESKQTSTTGALLQRFDVGFHHELATILYAERVIPLLSGAQKKSHFEFSKHFHHN